ncbi:hypothetical protein [Litoreibacter halocynthiae]|uniref:hypothetical protein n=1 Tax=Litoreibacter halocynthiae TaxID=1242689 RepID=UPI0024910F24|nr:hypothetical protein [Litoreibacter halocynthiae]
MKPIVFLLGILYCGSVWAKPAVVKSGEHDGFSRLVLYTGKAQTWSQSRSANSISVTIGGWTSGFDTSDVFRMIPPDRIARVESTNSSLNIVLDCNCPIDIQTVDRVGLLVDVFDEPVSLTTEAKPAPATYYWPDPEEFIRQRENTSAVSALRKNLSERIGKATTQQLLTPIPTKLPKSEALPAPTGAKLLPEPPANRIRTTSAFDRAARREHVSTATKPECPPERLGDIENWGTEFSFSDQISDARNSLVGEFDELDQAEALRLTKLYLYFAMGAEALATIDTLGLTGEQVQFLRPLAKILDGGNTANFPTKLPSNGCDGMLAVWAAISSSDDLKIAEPQAKVITESFNRLPHHLKSALGPYLMVRLHQDGQEIAVSVLRNSLARHHPDLEADAPVQGDLESLSVKDLMVVVEKSNSETPQALVLMLQQSIEKGLAVEPPMAEIARSFVVQQSGDKSSKDLTMLLAQNSVLRGDYADALDAAAKLGDDNRMAKIVSFAAKHLAQHGSDTDVAKFALRSKPEQRQRYLQPETIGAIEKRLKSASLDALAQAFSGRSTIDINAKSDFTANAENAVSSSALPSETIVPPTLISAKGMLGESKDLRQKIGKLLSPERASVVE